MRWGCSRRASRASWPSSACRAGAESGCARSASWSSPWTPMPWGSSNGGSSPARRRWGAITWRYYHQRPLAGSRGERSVGSRPADGGPQAGGGNGWRRGTCRACTPPRGLGGVSGNHDERGRCATRHRGASGMGGTPVPGRDARRPMPPGELRGDAPAAAGGGMRYDGV